MNTLVDPFEVVRPVSPSSPARVTYRARLPTLLDPYEMRSADAIDEDADWESKKREPCRIIVEHSPRGARSETWRRTRHWCAEEPTRRGRR